MNTQIRHYLRVLTNGITGAIFLTAMFSWVFPAQGHEKKVIPPLKEAIRIAQQHFSNGGAVGNSFSEISGKPSSSEVAYQVKKFYYQVLTKTEQMGIAEEVKEQFEKAVNKSQEKYDSGEGDITQSEITKLKLGLAGSQNDIIELQHGIQMAKISLGHLMGEEFGPETELTEEGVQPESFEYQTLEEFLKSVDFRSSGNSDFELQKAFLRVNETREKMHLAGKNRKITRALLVTEVANYDFGIGDSGDLFEALIIYTRVLSGYYESVYNFNVSVAEMYRKT